MNANPRLLLAGVLAAGLLAPAGCATGGAPAPSPSPPPAAAAAAFGGTDRSWIEINIAMGEELLPLLDLAPRNGSDPALQQLTAEVGAFTDEELGILRTLHREAGLPSENPHKGMPMPGMVTREKVAEAAALRGESFDALLRTCLEEHLKQGRQLAGSERTAGQEPRTVALAESIFADRTEALAQLAKQ